MEPLVWMVAGLAIVYYGIMGYIQYSGIDLRPKIGVGVIVFENEQRKRILLGKRIGGSHGNNTWQLPGGHMEYKETLYECAYRELKEETNLRAMGMREGPYVNCVFEKEALHYVTLLTIVDKFEGTLVNMEPKKCEGWRWVSNDELHHYKLFGPLELLLKECNNDLASL